MRNQDCSRVAVVVGSISDIYPLNAAIAAVSRGRKRAEFSAANGRGWTKGTKHGFISGLVSRQPYWLLVQVQSPCVLKIVQNFNVHHHFLQGVRQKKQPVVHFRGRLLVTSYLDAQQEESEYISFLCSVTIFTHHTRRAHCLHLGHNITAYTEEKKNHNNLWAGRYENRLGNSKFIHYTHIHQQQYWRGHCLLRFIIDIQCHNFCLKSIECPNFQI